MTKILVTGGAGYIGSRLVPELLAKNYEVRVIDSLMYGQQSLLPFFSNNNFEFILGDIRDRSTVEQALAGIDFVVHLAAIVGAPACKQDPKLAKEVNLDATILLKSCMSESQGLIFASTGSNYGVVEGICTETTPLRPISEYGITKTAAERSLVDYGDAIIYRYATAFGLSQRLRLDLLINNLAFQALKTGQLELYEAEFRRTFIHVSDIAYSFVHALENYERMNGEVYNAGHERMNYTKREVATMIQKKVGCLVEYANNGTDPDQRDYEVSYEKIRATGFETKVDLSSGIDELVKAYPMIHQRDGKARHMSSSQMSNVQSVRKPDHVA